MTLVLESNIPLVSMILSRLPTFQFYTSLGASDPLDVDSQVSVSLLSLRLNI